MVTAVVGAVIAWAVTRASLRPLREAEQTAARIAQGDLSQRITGAGDGTEAGALAQSLNGMLEQLDKAFSAQARSEEKLRAFLADASHELRTPLAAIQGYAELERTGAGSGDGSSLERIEANARRMGALVEDLLVLARYDDSSATLSGTDTVDLAALAQEVAADLRAQDPSRTVTVHVGAPARIQGSPRHLHQMLMNLGANALRHTPAGSPVEIACTPGDTHVNLTVLDHGPGIEESQRDNVFHRFVRLDESRARDTGGTGLGLAIVKAVAEAHGGTVQVQNSADAGAEFTVSLPYSHPSM